MGRFFDMYSAIQTKLSSIDTAPKIVYDNDKEYTPNSGTRYWALKISPIKSEVQTADGIQKHEGRALVWIYASKNKGIAQLSKDLDLITDEFNNGESASKNDTHVQFNGTTPGPFIVENGWCKTYIDIEYLCYSN